MNNHRLTAYIFLLATSIIWGFAGPVIKFTLGYFPPSVFLTYRFAVSAVVAILTFLVIPPRLPKNPASWFRIFLYGFLTSTVSLGLLFIGFSKTSALTGSLLSGVGPIMVAAAGVLFLHEHVTKRERIGISIAFLGTMLTVLEPLWHGGQTNLPLSLEGNLYHIASLVVGVATAVLAKIILRDTIEPLTLTHISFLIGFVTMAPIAFSVYPPAETIAILQHAPLASHLGVFYMALLSGTLAYTLWHRGEKSIEIGETSLFSYLMPVFAAPLSVVWLGETMTPSFLLGAAVIAAGVVIAEYKKSHSTEKMKMRRRRRKR